MKIPSATFMLCPLYTCGEWLTPRDVAGDHVGILHDCELVNLYMRSHGMFLCDFCLIHTLKI